MGKVSYFKAFCNSKQTNKKVGNNPNVYQQGTSHIMTPLLMGHLCVLIQDELQDAVSGTKWRKVHNWDL